jgi:EAL domain-containing protein (putative c-di-GMP-specific phosphodiesterase class I)/GGDEF domain-containing protein
MLPNRVAAPSITASCLSIVALLLVSIYFHAKKNISLNDGFIIAIVFTLIYATILWFNGIYPVYLLPVLVLLVTLFTSPNKSLILNSITLILVSVVLFIQNSDVPLGITLRIFMGSIFLVIFSNLIIRENRRLSNTAERLTNDLKELVKEISTSLSIVNIEKNDALRTDHLTGLMNETAIRDEIKKLIFSRKETSPIAIINLQFTKLAEHLAAHQINIHDAVLNEITSRIKKFFNVKTIGRLGKFDFIIAIEVGKSESGFKNNLKAIYSEINKAIYMPPNLIPLLPQMGVAFWPSSTINDKNLIRYAQVAALNSIENKMSEPVFFDQQMELNLAQTTYLTEQIPAAIAGQQFKVFYQPIFDLKTMRFAKAEALIRWDHPQKGLLLPSTFIPLVIISQNITDLTEVTINQVKLDLSAIEKEFNDDLQISINLSPHYLENTLENRNAVDFLKRVNFPKNKVILEITEEAILSTDSDMLGTLRDLKGLGLQIALDDFGTGYSSLSNLSVLPINYIKIDKSIINGIEQIPMNLKICKLITDLSHEAGWQVVAEGVENQNQLNLLKEINVDLIQGYLYSKPLPFDELKSFLFDKALAH